MNQSASNELNQTNQGQLLYVSPSIIRPLPIGDYQGNYRKKRPANKKKDVAESIKKNGILQSLVVRVCEECPDEYELIAGYGRLEIAIELGLKEVPILNKGDVSDQDALAMALTENIDRSELNIADEVEHAKRFLSIFNGCHKTAALRLNKSESVYRDLLQIGRCDESLIEALSDDSHPLLKGHCTILSQFPKEIQTKILKAIEAEPTKYTVSYLKTQSKNFELRLADARFDKSTVGCDDCQYNSDQQFNVFDTDSDDSKCSNPRCYLEHQNKWLNEVRIPDLKVQYGTVLTTEQKSTKDVKLVHDKALGAEQVKNCADCENCAVLVNVEPEHYGKAVSNLCIDLACYSKHEQAYSELINPTVKQDSDPAKSKPDVNNIELPPEKSSRKESSKNNTSVKSTPKLSKKLHRTYANMIQRVAVSNVSSQPVFTQALIVKALSSSLRSENRIKDSIESLITLAPEKLSALMQELLVKFAKQELDLDSEASDLNDFSANKVYRKSLEFFIPDEEERKRLMVSAWHPTKEILGMLTKQQIGNIATDSGFDVAYDTKNGSAAWAKLLNGKVGTLIATLLAFEFDWSNYAPDSFIELGVNYRKPV